MKSPTRAVLSATLALIAAFLLNTILADARSSYEFRRADAATKKACNALRSQLPFGRVTNQGLGPDYLVSVQTYYSQLQAKRFPACVAYPQNAQEVSTVVKAIKANNLQFAVKAGGHQFNNWSSSDGGVLIDLQRLTAKRFDDENKQVAYFEPGNRWRDVYSYFVPQGVTPVGGRLGGVGSGLALGGGLSYLSAEHGLVCDTFTALDVVLADGRIVKATADNEYKDLFKSLKGGGNRFGIVTGYHTKLVPVDKVYSGIVIYTQDQWDKVIKATSDFVSTNTDKKAAIITTVDSFGILPDPTTKLSSFIILFNVYNGADPGTTFDAFTKIPHVLDTRSTGDYIKAAEMVDIGTISQGGFYSNVVPLKVGSDREQTLVNNFKVWSKEHVGQYILATVDYQPIAKSITDASRAAGGNALGGPEGPYIFVNMLLAFDPNLAADKQEALRASWDKLTNSIPHDEDIPKFLNDAGFRQNILQSYEQYPLMQATSRKYDPTGLFVKNQPGPNFST
ncbi:fad binding domain-containing protein [Ceraceosorus bombacis]|uniref:Fad binding domain-containing protein n=1 Tax=Ceraceosorus bombacis TaxID=401625 RepID=A0A0P1BLT9_9BASI|nr:fad binding domain-containing protein [Ceraceosorus bombacis]